ncbi:MAG TPA: preprotein translocase subunit SecG [Woeseiaceae bacterium]|nr:preprotein translocase subunit SecG [Woeseiaceae bacterium]
MTTIQTVVLVAHTFIALLIIVLVLLQRGKGADAGAAFGAGASGTVFGARGTSSFFSRATAVLATAFFASSLALAYISSQHTDAPQSLIENAPAVDVPADETGDEGDGMPAATPDTDAPDVAGDEETAMPELPDEPAAAADESDDTGDKPR